MAVPCQQKRSPDENTQYVKTHCCATIGKMSLRGPHEYAPKGGVVLRLGCPRRCRKWTRHNSFPLVCLSPRDLETDEDKANGVNDGRRLHLRPNRRFFCHGQNILQLHTLHIVALPTNSHRFKCQIIALVSFALRPHVNYQKQLAKQENGGVHTSKRTFLASSTTFLTIIARRSQSRPASPDVGVT